MDNDINRFIYFFGEERIELESDNDSNSLSSPNSTRISSIEEIIEAIQEYLASVFSSVEETLPLLRALFIKGQYMSLYQIEIMEEGLLF